VRALAEYHKATVEVERLIGAPLNAALDPAAGNKEKK
jgi:hypothetical protein